ncbi:nucleotidyltransferase family protein [Cognatishimia activa]|uniref:nucleotidyltransferase family protein n=1 Tax=Cognatishimia activa TaxID=1715691 RepID=UPI002230146D|nr:nucleotidyltransferase family protein [Cognatishimia activa]UZD90734.1 nucleotidyltransferase family protein [Cognatishimia activa]
MRHRPNALMIFAAGFGTRMGALTANTPKPLIAVAGKPLIDHTINLANECCLDPILANLHYLPDQLEVHLHAQGVKTIREELEILETGGGLKNALPLLGDNAFITSNSDAIWKGPNPFQMAIDAWNPSRMDALLVCIPIGQCVGYKGQGDFILAKDGRLTYGPDDLVFGGIQVMKPELLEGFSQTKFSLRDVWIDNQDAGRIHGISYPGQWCDVGHPAGIDLAEALLRGDDV